MGYLPNDHRMGDGRDVVPVLPNRIECFSPFPVHLTTELPELGPFSRRVGRQLPAYIFQVSVIHDPADDLSAVGPEVHALFIRIPKMSLHPLRNQVSSSVAFQSSCSWLHILTTGEKPQFEKIKGICLLSAQKKRVASNSLQPLR